ncbi:MAG: winged helix-turn-helix domain-containing protein [Phycisphaeraceae bacterium]|nr:winged helix-turn-helix domain-containing protein [Phycisphaeraceae bacterium]
MASKKPRTTSPVQPRSRTAKPKAVVPGPAAAAPTPADVGPRPAPDAPSATEASTAKAPDTDERRGKGTPRPSGLTAAMQVLAGAGEPLSARQIVERMFAQGLWKTDGKTPHATIYAAIHREIAEKGTTARFAKVERGKFTLAAGQQPPY